MKKCKKVFRLTIIISILHTIQKLTVLNKLKYFFGILFLCLSSFVFAQEKPETAYNFSFKRFGANQGLSLSAASCILQDKYGFMWVGTSDGLFRFDGYQFISFRYNPEDDKSISGNIINCILEDSKGNIWVGTDNGGLCYYDRNSRSFVRIPKLYWKKEMYKIQSISSLLEDSNGRIWFSNSQFQYFVLDTKSLEIFPLKYDLLERLPDYYRVTSMFEDKNKTVWLATQFGLYYSLNTNKKSNDTFFAEKIFKKIPDMGFHSIVPNPRSNDSIYLVTNFGDFLSFNVTTGAYKYEYKQLSNALSQKFENVQSAIIDKLGNWWVATYKGGLYYYSIKTRTVQIIKNEVYNTNSLSFNFTNKVYEDKDGLIWVCTDGGGINLLNPKASVFEVYQHSPFNANSLSNNDVWGIYATSDYWLAGTSDGLTYYDKKNDVFKKFVFEEQANSGSASSFYSSVEKAGESKFWVGSDGDGIFSVDLNTGKMEKLLIKNLKNIGASGNSVSCFIEQNNELWIGTYNEGLLRYDFESQTAKLYKHSASPNSIAQNAITSLHFTPDGHLWIGTQDNGVNRLNITSDQFTWISTTSKGTGHLSSDVAVSLMEDKHSTLWVGTERGVNAINTKSNQVYAFNKLPGGSIDIVYSVVEDNFDNIWMSTNKGIFSFKNPGFNNLFNNQRVADSIIETSLRNFDDTDGLPSKEFNQGAFSKDETGQIYFGGVNGLVSFEPEQILKLQPPKPRLYLQSFNLFEKSITLDTIFNDKKRIELSYKDNYFSIEFVSPNYLNPNKIKYRYMLEGLDNNWITTSYQQKISYPNVSPGTYRFRINVTDSNGRWMDDEKSFSIIIEPPFWKTNVFYAASILLIIAAMASYTRLRERSLRRENRLLEEKVVLRTKDVLSQKEIVEEKSLALEDALLKINENINYSAKIKGAILPTLGEIQKLFPETFIVYRPKIAVSGDFYFFAKQDTASRKSKYAVLGVADSSGHGVPGALMSVIGSTLLNDIVNLKGITKPAHILDELQLGVRETLKITEANNYDAEKIELVMCKFNFENNQLEYAGAKLSAYIVRNHQVIELKGDKMVIGAGSANLYERFTENLFQLQKGDCIYLCTDGFANQFGGEKNKKFKTYRLKEMLVTLHTTSHIRQSEEMNRIFDQWKGANEQVDDMLIVGLRYE